MSVRHKNWAAGDQLKAVDMNNVANNGVVQVDTIAELTDVFDNQTGVNVVFCLEDVKLYSRGDTEFSLAAVGNGSASFDEEASTGITFTDLPDPDGDGKNYRLATCDDGASLVLSGGGEARCLVIGGGGGGGRESQGGGAGQMIDLKLSLPEGTHPITVGTGGGFGDWAGSPTGHGTPSSIGTEVEAMNGFGGGKNGYQYGSGGVGAAGDMSNFASGRRNTGGAGGFGTGAATGKESNITGTDVLYACGGGTANPGSGGGGGGGESNGGAGQTGIVLVRVEI